MKHCLSYLLITLIAMQSLWAVADMHMSHQSESAHLLLDTSLKVDNTEFEQKEDISSCQHCCHCHSPQLTLLGNTATPLIKQYRQQLIVELNHAALPAHPSSLFRPPRV